MIKKTIHRGDLFYYDFGKNEGSVQNGVRPVMVVQSNDYNQNVPTIVVAVITSAVKRRYLPSHIFIGENFGLKKPSMVLLEQVTTVNKDKLKDYIGTVDDNYLLRRINNSLKKVFGLWHYKVQEKNIRCLCRSCLNDYIQNPNYIVKRLDPFASIKDKCDKCTGMGWDYLVIEKSNLYKKGRKIPKV